MRRSVPFYAAASLPPLLVYGLTRATTWALDSLYTIDSAEMVLAAVTMGIDHPPGHPLYLLLAHCFSLLPFSVPDEGVILCSSVAAAAASCLLASAVRTRTGNDLAALTCGWAFAFTLVIWFHATIAEVYAVQLACVAGFYAAIAHWVSDRHPAALILSWFALGLTASANVLLSALLAPVALYVVWRSGIHSPRQLANLLASFSVGASALLYIPIRLNGDGFISDFVFLSGHKPGSLRWAIWYFSAEEFTATKLTTTPLSSFPSLITAYTGSFLENASPFMAILVLLGVYSAMRSVTHEKGGDSAWQRVIAPSGPKPYHFEIALILGFILTLIPVLPYDVADREVFYMPSFLHLALLGGVGIWRLLDTIRSSTFPDAAKPWAGRLIAALIPIYLLASHYGTVQAVASDRSEYETRKDRFTALPKGAIVTTTDDGRATRWKYWQTVLGMRQDVSIETMGRLAPRYQPEQADAQATGAAREIAPSLNVADRLRVLKGLLAAHPDRPLFTILDDRLPPELDHFRVRRADFDPRLLRISAKPPPETSPGPLASTISADTDHFAPVDIIGLDIRSLDGGMSRGFPNTVPLKWRVISGIIQRSEFVEIDVVAMKREPGQYFAELVFVDEDMRIPGGRGFTAARSLEIAPEALRVGHYLRDRITIKIPAFIPNGHHTVAVALNRVSSGQTGTYRGKAVKQMDAVPATRQWAGQARYQPLARIWIE